MLQTDAQCAHNKVEEFNKWLSKRNELPKRNGFKVLITGKTGTGKTTLMKGLKENYVPDEDNNLLPHTTEVTPFEYTHDTIDFTFFDTPGLKDESDGANDYTYLKDMVRNSQEPDLVIYTIKMDDTEFREEDIASIREITDAFGWKAWKHAMFVLTFANKVFVPDASVESRENRVSYNRIRDEFALKVTKLLRDCKVQENVANEIPIIPVGLVAQPIIPSDSRQESWLKEFWQAVNARLKPEEKENPCPVCNCECPAKKSSSKHAYPSRSFCALATVVILFCRLVF